MPSKLEKSKSNHHQHQNLHFLNETKKQNLKFENRNNNQNNFFNRIFNPKLKSELLEHPFSVQNYKKFFEKVDTQISTLRPHCYFKNEPKLFLNLYENVVDKENTQFSDDLQCLSLSIKILTFFYKELNYSYDSIQYLIHSVLINMDFVLTDIFDNINSFFLVSASCNHLISLLEKLISLDIEIGSKVKWFYSSMLKKKLKSDNIFNQFHLELSFHIRFLKFFKSVLEIQHLELVYEEFFTDYFLLDEGFNQMKYIKILNILNNNAHVNDLSYNFLIVCLHKSIKKLLDRNFENYNKKNSTLELTNETYYEILLVVLYILDQEPLLQKYYRGHLDFEYENHEIFLSNPQVYLIASFINYYKPDEEIEYIFPKLMTTLLVIDESEFKQKNCKGLFIAKKKKNGKESFNILNYDKIYVYLLFQLLLNASSLSKEYLILLQIMILYIKKLNVVDFMILYANNNDILKIISGVSNDITIIFFFQFIKIMLTKDKFLQEDFKLLEHKKLKTTYLQSFLSQMMGCSVDITRIKSSLQRLMKN